jgi:Flp pilus assembly pilin Flp
MSLTGSLFNPVREFGPTKGAAMKRLSCLWSDTRGTSSVVSLILLTTIVTVGVVAGMVTLRDQIVQQFGDVSVALESLDQSYSFSIVTPNSTVSSQYADQSSGLTDPNGQEPAGLDVHTVSATVEQ